jgi:hypothetical protein
MTMGLLHLAATDVKAQIKCVPKVAPKIKVLPTKAQLKYNFTKTKYDLERFDIDTVSPYDPNSKTHVGGLMSGKIQLTQQTEFMNELYDHVGYGCVYIKKVDVKIHVDPTIYVAREYKRGSCKHNEILKHERRHVREDQLIVNKYSKLVADDLKASLDVGGYSFGPYKTSELAGVQKRLQGQLEGLVIARHDAMNIERKKRQQAIDSLEEYDFIAEQCPRGR